MESFWDYSVWGFMSVISVLLLSLLAANALKKNVALLQRSLIPTSVLGGALLLVVVVIYRLITGDRLFDTAFFNNCGTNYLEMVTYHTLALGFIASALKSSKGKLNKKRTAEIFNTGITTVSTYLLQGVVGMVITIICAGFMTGLLDASGLLLAFGFGQGTGQAMNYGGIYAEDYGFLDGKSFGLSIAALGFICASLGGVIHLHVMRKQGKICNSGNGDENLKPSDIQGKNEIPMQESIDKLTIQIALIFGAYFLSYLMMFGLGKALPGMRSVIYGFNFLLGVISATIVKVIKNFLKKHNISKKEYTNDFLLTRTSNFFFDVMVVAGIAAIRLEAIEKYWLVLLILAVAGFLFTYSYNRLVAKVLFKEYSEEQFMVMYGMLTGTASTGIILLREVDGDFKTPAADNIVYQNFPAIVFGFPLMFLATLAPKKPILTLCILIAMLVVMNVVLFRSLIFRRRGSKKAATEEKIEETV